MGNCMETCSLRRKEQEEVKGGEAGVLNEKKGFEREDGDLDQDKGSFKKEEQKGGGFKVNIVLTRAELDWLLLQLKEKGGKRLEEVLEEIEKGREKSEKSTRVQGSWKPSLESITECPEVQSF